MSPHPLPPPLHLLRRCIQLVQRELSFGPPKVAQLADRFGHPSGPTQVRAKVTPVPKAEPSKRVRAKPAKESIAPRKRARASFTPPASDRLAAHLEEESISPPPPIASTTSAAVFSDEDSQMQTESLGDGGMKRVVGAVAVTLVTLESIAAEEEAARAVSREPVEGCAADESPARIAESRGVSMSTTPTDAVTAAAGSGTAMATRPNNAADVGSPSNAGTTGGGADTDVAATTDGNNCSRSDCSDESDSDSDDDYEEARRRNIEANK